MPAIFRTPFRCAEIRRALVTKLRHHGDVLLTSPVFSTLKRAAPQMEIDALVYRETSPMLANHPAIAAIHVIDRDWKRRGLAAQVAGEWALYRTLRARNYDLLIHLTEHPRGADARAPAAAALRRHARAAARAMAVAAGVHAFLQAAEAHAAPRGRSESRRTAAYRRLSGGCRQEGRAGPGRSRRRRASMRCCASTASTTADSSRRIPARAGCSSAAPAELSAELFARIAPIGPPRRDHRRARRPRARARRRDSRR